jgi:hypothetical protein
MNSECGVFVGVGKMLLFESIALLTILAFWYAAQLG